MHRHIALGVLGSALALAVVSAQHPGSGPNVLGTVHIGQAVLADGKPLASGTYELRLTGDAAPALVGQPQGAQAEVEFVSGGEVIAHEIAEVLRDSDRPVVGASSQPARDGARVEMLKGGEFLRVSVKRDGVRYLVYLPVAGQN